MGRERGIRQILCIRSLGSIWAGYATRNAPLIEHIVQSLVDVVALLEYHRRPSGHGDLDSINVLHQVEIRLVIAEARTEEDLRIF